MGRANTKHNHIANVNLVLNHLRKTTPEGGATLTELAELCGVSTRNIYRYLNELEEIGFDIVRPIQNKPGIPGHGKYRLRNRTLPYSRIDANLMMLIGVYAQKQLHYHEQLQLIYEFFIRHMAIKNHLTLPANWKLEDLKQSSAKNTVTYLHSAKDHRKTSKSESIVIMLSASAAKKYRKAQPPFNAVEKEMPDGSLQLTLTQVSSQDILPWLFQWGGETEIITPVSLRTKLTDFCKTILQVHSDKYLSGKIS